MQEEALRIVIEDICRQKTEKQTLELKSAHGGFPGRIYDTLSSFSNQDEGGILLFGITDKPDYAVVGVYDAEDAQKKIMEACSQMEPKVRPLLTMCEIDGKMVISAEIPGVDPALRPVFYKGAGRLRGSFIRVGDADEPMSEYEIYSYEVFRRRIKDELRTVDRVRLSLFDKERMAAYLASVKSERKNLAENVSDEDILELMGVTCEGKPTLAGIMTFSRYPQTYFPQLCITAVAVPGTQMGDTDTDGSRFLDNVRITGAIPEMLTEAVEFVRRNSRTKTVVDENGRRTDRPEYPLRAVREAILNALVHRDYSIYSENTPVSLEMYRDRMTIRNRGGLYGGGSVKQLGKGRPETRNAALANMLEVLKITENRYSGIPTIRKELAMAGLPEPEFTVQRGDFEVTFRNGVFVTADEIGKANLPEAILQFCRQPRSRKELVAFTGKSQYYTMSAIVQPLLDAGKLKYTLPDKPKSPKQRFVTTD
ncbi:MAG: putative DNA binding domain-containing protein [Acidaminococcaceae bacterium]|nr:putative DNA binding domain-containing protein [Acidaminococcaceae bacterium]